MDISNNKEVLRIATAGSVDDGKSTLIGRLLHDTNSIPVDKLEAIEKSSKRKGLDYIDLSLLTDGLVAEREQGITIDVAHIYFSTPNRKYIIADTPGHVEYTRNMVTGASTADVSIILVDARQGLVDQTYSHLYISHLLRVSKVIVCVNKMDLVDYSQAKFEEIKSAFNTILTNENLAGLDVDFIPVSSLSGHNVVTRGDKTPWYKGDSLLEKLELLEVHTEDKQKPARFPVQYVIRPKSDTFHDYRGYAGKVVSGAFSVGDEVIALPSGETSTIQAIDKFDQSIDEALPKQSVTIRLENDIDLSRGEILVKKYGNSVRQVDSQICWMDRTKLSSGGTYKLKHGVNEVRAKVSNIAYKVATDSFIKDETVTELGLNDIGEVSFKLSRPIFADKYEENKENGAFILIDEQTNGTVGVGFVK